MPTATADPVASINGLSETERKERQRHTLRVLFPSQVAGAAGISVAVSVGGPAAKAMLGADTFAGSASAALTFGGALAGLALATVMKRRGRRPGLQRGYALAFFGGCITVLGIEKFWFPLFIVGLMVFGIGQGTNLLARYAAADLSLPNERGRAIALLLFANTFGSVASQVLVGWCEGLAEDAGLRSYSGPFIFGMVLLVVAFVNTSVRLRPDPLVLAGGTTPDERGISLPPLGHALRIIRGIPMARLALVTMMTSQAVMVGVMTMTPIHMKDHGHSTQLTGNVIALHIVGMFGLAPIVGRLSDRYGRVRIILIGAVLLVAATIVSAIAGYRPSLLFLGLFFLGLGWSGAMVGGSALLTESVPLKERVAVQGSADLLMSLCGAAAGFSSGFVKRAWGYHMLSQIGAVAAVALVVVALRASRTLQLKGSEPRLAP